MITALDTSVLLDVAIPDAAHGEESRLRLKNAYGAGDLVICEVVYGELVPSFCRRFAEQARAELDAFLAVLGVTHLAIDAGVAFEAGARWLEYRESGGPRDRILADFLIGAQAYLRADQLLTRDRGFYRSYFPELTQASGNSSTS